MATNATKKGTSSSSSSSSSNDFVKLEEGVYVRKGAEVVNASHPRVILIFSWMGAMLPHIHKYTTSYKDLYPTSTIVLVQCSPTEFLKFETTRQKCINPVLEILLAEGCLPPRSSQPQITSSDQLNGVLTHSFSNGGCYQLLCLHRAISNYYATSSSTSQVALAPTLFSSLPSTAHSALILDSCPGTRGLISTKRAFYGLTKSRLLQFLINFLFTIMYWSRKLGVYLRIVDRDDWIALLEKNLNKIAVARTVKSGKLAANTQTTYIPWLLTHAPRLYIYSVKDELVPYQAIERHAKEVKEVGSVVNVKLVRFDDTPHVAHARAHPERYWAEVKTIWDGVAEKRREKIK